MPSYHAIRLNRDVEDNSLNKLWRESDLYPEFLNFSNNGYKIVRRTYFEKFSQEEKLYKIYKKVVYLYRLLIGQADLSLFDLETETEKIDEIQRCFICLSPYYQNKIKKGELK